MLKVVLLLLTNETLAGPTLGSNKRNVNNKQLQREST